MTNTSEPQRRVNDGPLLDLHGELIAAIEAERATEGSRSLDRGPTRRWLAESPRQLLAAAAVLLIALAGVLAVVFATDDDVAVADVKVGRNGSMITVSVEDDIDTVAVSEALDRAGVKVTVVGVPTGPSMVDRFVGIIGPPSAVLAGGDGTGSNRATFKAGSKVTLQLGVAARPGEPYGASPTATDPGEPFEGLVLQGRPFSEVRGQMEQRAAERGVTIDYRGSDGQPTSTPNPDGQVFGTVSMSSDKVLVLVN